jgi:integrase/recombinase XerD
MAKPLVVEDSKLDHMLKATAGYSRTPERDAALLLVLYGTGLSTTELAKITVGDYLEPTGRVRVTSLVRVNVSHNGESCPLCWSSKRVALAVDKYLEWRLLNKHGATIKKGAYRGLDPPSRMFLTPEGQPYSLTAKALPSGIISYSCTALGTVISKLHAHAGIEGGNAQATRRTLAVKLHRKGYDLVHIKTILGHKSVETTKRLVDGDPVMLANIIAGAV